MSKPVISHLARERILGFVNAVEALQVTYGVSIHADEDMICLRDDKRTDEWTMADGTVYGERDAHFFGTAEDHTLFCMDALDIEDFEGWDK